MSPLLECGRRPAGSRLLLHGGGSVSVLASPDCTTQLLALLGDAFAVASGVATTYTGEGSAMVSNVLNLGGFRAGVGGAAVTPRYGHVMGMYVDRSVAGVCFGAGAGYVRIRTALLKYMRVFAVLLSSN